MSVRLRDTAVLLEPTNTANAMTGASEPDWDKPPAREVPTRAKVEPIFTEEAVLTADTVISRWLAYLPPEHDGVVTPQWRVRWDGDDYEIDGGVERWKRGTTVRYLTVILERVD